MSASLPLPSTTSRVITAVAVLVACALALVGLLVGPFGVGSAGAAAGVAALDEPASGLVQADRGRIRREVPATPAGKIPFPTDGSTGCYMWSQSFGRVPSSSPTGKHEGTDIGGVAHRPVYAVEAGVLSKRYANSGTSGSGYGWTLTGDSGVMYRYFHMATDDYGWSVGDRVALGDILGAVGDTGTQAGNYHLHFEYRPDDVPVDPLPVLDVPATCKIY